MTTCTNFSDNPYAAGFEIFHWITKNFDLSSVGLQEESGATKVIRIHRPFILHHEYLCHQNMSSHVLSFFITCCIALGMAMLVCWLICWWVCWFTLLPRLKNLNTSDWLTWNLARYSWSSKDESQWHTISSWWLFCPDVIFSVKSSNDGIMLYCCVPPIDQKLKRQWILLNLGLLDIVDILNN